MDKVFVIVRTCVLESQRVYSKVIGVFDNVDSNVIESKAMNYLIGYLQDNMGYDADYIGHIMAGQHVNGEPVISKLDNGYKFICPEFGEIMITYEKVKVTH